MNIKALRIETQDTEKQQIMQCIESVLQSEIKWTNSTFVNKFENCFKEYSSHDFCVAVSSGSTAIESTLIALNAFDSVIFVPVLTAPATALSCLNLRSKIVFVDANNDFMMDPVDLENKINQYKALANQMFVVYVHIGGHMSSDIIKVQSVTQKYNACLIEDCAHAHGAKLGSNYPGDFGVAGTYSFFLTKSITCGEGGIIVTSDRDLRDKLQSIRNYGKNINGDYCLKGSSWRMNEFTASVAYIETMHFDKKLKQKQAIAGYYDQFFLENSVWFHPLQFKKSQASGYYKYILYNFSPKFDYKDFKSFMNQNGIELPAKVIEKPINKEPVFSKFDEIVNRDDDFKNACFLCEHHVCLPIYSAMTIDEAKFVADKVIEYEQNTF